MRSMDSQKFAGARDVSNIGQSDLTRYSFGEVKIARNHPHLVRVQCWPVRSGRSVAVATNTLESALVGWRASFARDRRDTDRPSNAACRSLQDAVKPISSKRFEQIIKSAKFEWR